MMSHTVFSCIVVLIFATQQFGEVIGRPILTSEWGAISPVFSGRMLVDYQDGGSSATPLRSHSCPDGNGDSTLLSTINLLRARYAAGPLVWDDTLASVAQTLLLKQSTCTPGTSTYQYSADGLVGLQYFAEGPTSGVSFKCVQAVNAWFVDAFDFNYTWVTPRVNTQRGSALPFSVLLWNSSSSVGCGLVECGDAGAQVIGFGVACLWSDLSGQLSEMAGWKGAELEAAVEDVVAGEVGAYPAPFRMTRGDSPETLGLKWNMTAAQVMCYQEQVGGSVDFFPLDPGTPPTLSILRPPPDSAGGNVTCWDYQYYAGTTPSTWLLTPMDTWSSVAQHFNLTEEDLCCFNAHLNTSAAGGCGGTPSLAGADSLLLIPDGKLLERRNCSVSASQRLGSYSCPDINQTVFLMNQLREVRGLGPLAWDEELAMNSSSFLEASSCANPFSGVLPITGLNATLSGPATAPQCSGGVLMNWGVVAREESGAPVSFWAGEYGSQAGTLRNLQATILNNLTTHFGCALQVCGPYWTNVWCAFSGSPAEEFEAAAKVALREGDATASLIIPPSQATCPQVVFTQPGNVSLESFAASQGLQPQEVVCWGGQLGGLEGAQQFQLRWATGLPVGVPCPGAQGDPQQLTCPHWQLLQGECGVWYVANAGDSMAGVASLVSGQEGGELSSEALCCHQRGMGAAVEGRCDLAPLEQIYLPCPNELEAARCSLSDIQAAMAAAHGSSGKSLALPLGLGLGIGLALVAWVVCMGAVWVWRGRRRGAHHTWATQNSTLEPLDAASSFSLTSSKALAASVPSERYEWQAGSWREDSGAFTMVGQEKRGERGGVVVKLYKQRDAFERERSFYLSGATPELFPRWYEADDGRGKGGLPCLVLEQGLYSLDTFLSKEAGPPSSACIKSILSDVMDSLQQLHGRGLVHGALTPQRVMFFTASHRWKLVDLSHCCASGELAPQTAAAVRYCAPEVVQAACAGARCEMRPSADMWSFGLIAWECLTGTPLFSGLSDQQLEHMLLNNAPLPFEEQLNFWDAIREPQAQRVVLNLLHRVPAFRWDVKMCMGNAFFREADDTVMKQKSWGKLQASQRDMFDRTASFTSQVRQLSPLKVDEWKSNVSKGVVVQLVLEEVTEDDDTVFDSATEQEALAEVVLRTDEKDPNAEAQLLYEKYDAGQLSTSEAPLSLLSNLSQEEQQVFLVHMNGQYVLRLQLVVTGLSEVPFERMETVTLRPLGNPYDAVQLPVFTLPCPGGGDTMAGFALWDMSRHASSQFTQTNVTVAVELTVKLKMKVAAESVSVRAQMHCRIHEPGQAFTVQRLAPRLLTQWPNAPDWLKLGALGAQWLFKLV